jgi:hypothetical protein
MSPGHTALHTPVHQCSVPFAYKEDVAAEMLQKNRISCVADAGLVRRAAKCFQIVFAVCLFPSQQAAGEGRCEGACHIHICGSI